jgi:endogenous inhibitor of DNA gyrase (YacG/DUF329 family)
MKKCENCDIEIDWVFGSGRFCSRKCACSFSTKEKRKEINEKVSKKLTQERTKKKCLECGLLFESYSRINRKYCSKTCYNKNAGGWKNHHKVNWSVVNKKSYKDGKNYVAGGTTKWIETKTLKGIIKVQGSYEFRTCKILDNWVKEGKIKDWDYSKDRFNYIGVDDKEHTYIIDFKVYNNDDTFYYIETKGYIRENDELKWESVRDSGYKIEVWFLKDIEEKEKIMGL